MNTERTQYEITVGTQGAIDTLGMDVVMQWRERWAKQLAEHFGGVTVLREKGGYIMDNGEYVTEDVYIYRVIEMAMKGERTFINALAAEMCETFGEECVLVTQSTIDAQLVRAGGVACH